MGDVLLQDLWFHQVEGVEVGNAVSEGELVTVRARTGGEQAACPACGTLSSRIHRRYVRRLADSAVGGRRVLIELQVRRFRCCASACRQATCAEQVDGLTFRHGRRSAVRGCHPGPPVRRSGRSEELHHCVGLQRACGDAQLTDADRFLVGEVEDVHKRCPRAGPGAGCRLTGRPARGIPRPRCERPVRPPGGPRRREVEPAHQESGDVRHILGLAGVQQEVIAYNPATASGTEVYPAVRSVRTAPGATVHGDPAPPSDLRGTEKRPPWNPCRRRTRRRPAETTAAGSPRTER
ncbi:transposase family protein [Streptomyces sp. NPDC006739]|uniref:transposase family protein n=1 Tax=Streptomyces sp. NPDC006739 TaxID=3364763 RepID=UPI0036C1B934